MGHDNYSVQNFNSRGKKIKHPKPKDEQTRWLIILFCWNRSVKGLKAKTKWLVKTEYEYM